MEESDFEGFSGNSSASEGDQEAACENLYYQAKALKNEEPEEAIEALDELFRASETSQNCINWRFKVLKQKIKILCIHGQVKSYVEQLLLYKSVISLPYYVKSICNLIDFVEGNCKSKSETEQILRLIQLSEVCTRSESSLSDKLLFKSILKLANVMQQNKEWSDLLELIETEFDLNVESRKSDPNLSFQLLELNSLLIEACYELKKFKKAKDIYWKCTESSQTLSHPIIIGKIREFGGMILFHDENFQQSLTSFFDAFKNFDEAGSSRKFKLLEYFLLTHTLIHPEVDPFGSQELVSYKNEPKIKKVVDILKDACNLNLQSFRRNIEMLQTEYEDDSFILAAFPILERKIIERSIKNFFSNSPKATVFLDAMNIQVDNISEIISELLLKKEIEDYSFDFVQNSLIRNEPVYWKYQKFNSLLNNYAEQLADLCENAIKIKPRCNKLE